MHIWMNGEKVEYPEGTIVHGVVAGEYWDDQNSAIVSHLAIIEENIPGGWDGYLYAYGIWGPKTLIDQQGQRLRTSDKYRNPTINITITLPDGTIQQKMKLQRAHHTRETWAHESAYLDRTTQTFHSFSYTKILDPSYLDARKPEERDPFRVLTIRKDIPENLDQLHEHWLADIDARTTMALYDEWATTLYEQEQINGSIKKMTSYGLIGLQTQLDETRLRTNVEVLYSMGKLARPEAK